MTSEPVTSIDDLLEHRSWVRDLARSLVVDRAHADDIEQEVWLRALRSPPRAASRSWLARVLRRVVSDSRRGEGRRRRHETEASLGGGGGGGLGGVGGGDGPAAASAADLAAHVEQHQRVVAAVLALPEPYRHAVLLRYYEGLDGRAIGARTGVGDETARKRVQRGLQIVRERLDAKSGGDGRAWRGGLLVLLANPHGSPLGTATTTATTTAAAAAATTTTSITAGGVLMAGNVKVLAAVAALVVVVAGLGYVAVDSTSSRAPAVAEVEGDSRASGDAGSGDANSRGDVSSGAPRSGGTRPRPSGTSNSTAGRGGDAINPDTTAAGGTDQPGPTGVPGRISGRVFDAQRRPIPNAVVEIRRDPHDEESMTVQTDADGAFALDGLEEGEYYAKFVADGLASSTLLLAAGAVPTAVTLTPPLALAGILVDAESGAPVPEAIVLMGTSAPLDHRAARTQSDVDGRFRFDDLAPGPRVLQVGLRYAGKDAGYDYDVLELAKIQPGVEELRIELRRGLLISGTIVDAQDQPVTKSLQLWVRGRRATGEIEYGNHRSVHTNEDGTFVVRGLLPGSYDLTFSTITGVAADEGVGGATVLSQIAAGSENLVVRMATAAVIAGVVVDDEGTPIEPTRGGWMQAVPAGQEPGSSGAVGIVVDAGGKFRSPAVDASRTYFLIGGGFVGHGVGRAESVRPGQTDARLVLARTLFVSGTVVDAEGKPVGVGVPVLAVAEAVDLSKGHTDTHGFAFTDAQGRFRIEGLGAYAFRITAGGGVSSFATAGAQTGVKAGTADLVVKVQQGVSITGKLVDSAGDPVQTTHLAVRSPTSRQFEPYARAEGVDASFAVHSLVPGEYRLFALLDGVQVFVGVVNAPSEDVVVVVPDR